jgi:protein-S-isoprenylcysteine O-methyltransferase Ste14
VGSLPGTGNHHRRDAGSDCDRGVGCPPGLEPPAGQRGVGSGPYQLVRHPEYLGSVACNLVVPLALGSLWAYIPALLTIALVIVRTGLEEEALRAELPGCRAHAAAVRYRLFPGAW